VDVEKGVGSVELGEFPKTHPFAGLQGADNVVEIQARSISHWSPYDRVRAVHAVS
jgi:aspartokinase/homoserine dehydrogenase 1